MRYFTCLLVALCISASTLFAADPNGQQLSPSGKQQISRQGTKNQEAYELYLKGRSYWDKRTLPDLETAVSLFRSSHRQRPRLRSGVRRAEHPPMPWCLTTGVVRAKLSRRRMPPPARRWSWTPP